MASEFEAQYFEQLTVEIVWRYSLFPTSAKKHVEDSRSLVAIIRLCSEAITTTRFRQGSISEESRVGTRDRTQMGSPTQQDLRTKSGQRFRLCPVIVQAGDPLDRTG